MKRSALVHILKSIESTMIAAGLILGTIIFFNASTNARASLRGSQGWIINSTTSHYYKLLTNCSGWHSCEEAAIIEGAHLVTINDASEQDWLVSTFGSADLFWIGFTDENDEGNWYWISGETTTYTNWASGEPSNSGDAEHFALMNWTTPGLWNDGHEAAITSAIIERIDPPHALYLPIIFHTSLTGSQGWIINSTTSHYYKLLTNCSGWHSCEEAAISEGAHLVTINDASEQDWLVSTFGSVDLFWIGFTDENDEGNWHWISGETTAYTNWASGEPSNSGDAEHYALMNWTTPGLWNDGHEAAITSAIIERTDSPHTLYLP